MEATKDVLFYASNTLCAAPPLLLPPLRPSFSVKYSQTSVSHRRAAERERFAVVLSLSFVFLSSGADMVFQCYCGGCFKDATRRQFLETCVRSGRGVG